MEKPSIGREINRRIKEEKDRQAISVQFFPLLREWAQEWSGEKWMLLQNISSFTQGYTGLKARNAFPNLGTHGRDGWIPEPKATSPRVL